MNAQVADAGIGMLLVVTFNVHEGEGTNSHNYARKAIVKHCDRLFYREMHWRRDNETVLERLIELAARDRHHPTKIEDSPSRSPQSLGLAERSVRTVKEQFKTVRYATEAAYGCE